MEAGTAEGAAQETPTGDPPVTLGPTADPPRPDLPISPEMSLQVLARLIASHITAEKDAGAPDCDPGVPSATVEDG